MRHLLAKAAAGQQVTHGLAGPLSRIIPVLQISEESQAIQNLRITRGR